MLLKVIVYLWKPIVNMLYREHNVSSGLNASKLVILTSVTKNDLVRQKKIDEAELQALLDENACQTQKEFAMQVNVDQPTVSRHLHAIGKIRKLEE